jgi:O-6-methylguanine DNA methyltransferase
MNLSETIYNIVSKVPKGKVTTYKAVASAAKNPGLARYVGNLMNKNPDTERVPCHRVVRSDGYVGGYARGGAEKIRLLRAEGIEVVSGKVDLNRFGYSF